MVLGQASAASAVISERSYNPTLDIRSINPDTTMLFTDDRRCLGFFNPQREVSRRVWAGSLYDQVLGIRPNTYLKIWPVSDHDL
jgi:hypothetical protein